MRVGHMPDSFFVIRNTATVGGSGLGRNVIRWMIHSVYKLRTIQVCNGKQADWTLKYENTCCFLQMS